MHFALRVRIIDYCHFPSSREVRYCNALLHLFLRKYLCKPYGWRWSLWHFIQFAVMSGEGARVGTSPEKTNTCSVNSRFPDFPLLPDTEELNPAPVGPLPGFFLHMEDWLTSLNCYRDLVPYVGPSSVPNYPHKADIRVYLSFQFTRLLTMVNRCMFIYTWCNKFLPPVLPIRLPVPIQGYDLSWGKEKSRPEATPNLLRSWPQTWSRVWLCQ